MADILVIGSLNADLVVRTARFPKPGETISGGDLVTIPGGKGANQAVAAARLGASTAMLGRVGNDRLGPMLMESLAQAGVDASKVSVSSSATGTAVIIVDDAGQNAIVLSAGANALVDQTDVRSALPGVAAPAYILLQLEIPIETVVFAARTARFIGAQVILNPAPAQALPPELFAMVDYLVPNETELSLLTGLPVSDPESAQVAARALVEKGAPRVVVTLGASGVVYVDSAQSFHIPAFSVSAVDTTAAGDAFIAGMAASLAGGAKLRDSLVYASACGALAATKFGAQPSLPTAQEVERFLELYAEPKENSD